METGGLQVENGCCDPHEGDVNTRALRLRGGYRCLRPPCVIGLNYTETCLDYLLEMCLSFPKTVTKCRDAGLFLSHGVDPPNHGAARLPVPGSCLLPARGPPPGRLVNRAMALWSVGASTSEVLFFRGSWMDKCFFEH